MEIICNDCGKELKKNAEYMEYKDGSIKCKKCHQINPIGNFQKCEVYSRVVGYIRPVQQWHKGKQQEFKDRVIFKNK